MTREQRGDNWMTLGNDLPSAISTPCGYTACNGRLITHDATGDDLWEVDLNDPEGSKLNLALSDYIRDLPTQREPWSEDAMGLCFILFLWVITLLGFWLAIWLI